MLPQSVSILLISLGTQTLLLAQTLVGCESVRSGDWADPATWSCNRLPTTDDPVTINSGHTVTISTSNAQAKHVSYKGGLLQFSETTSKLYISATNGATPVIYRIRAGQQTADQSALVFTPKTTLSFSATFDSSAIYTSQLPENQEDINKLYGFSDCDTHHSIASARFGWNWRNNALWIYAYCYRNGQRVSQALGTVFLNVAYDYQLSIVEGNYVFTFKGQQTTIARGCTTVPSSQRYLLYPYFGGDEVAPHDITISITENN